MKDTNIPVEYLPDTVHMCADIETLSTQVDAIILSVGAIIFTTSGDELGTYYVEVNPSEQLRPPYGKSPRHLCPDTLDWWTTQGAGKLTVLPTDRVTLKTALLGLNEFVHKHKPKFSWSRGTDFDISILVHAIGTWADTKPAWPYNGIRDSRTLLNLFPVKLAHVNPNPHNALADAVYEAELLRASLHRANKAWEESE